MSEWNCRSVDRWPEATWGQAAGGLGNERWIPAFIESLEAFSKSRNGRKGGKSSEEKKKLKDVQISCFQETPKTDSPKGTSASSLCLKTRDSKQPSWQVGLTRGRPRLQRRPAKRFTRTFSVRESAR